MNNLEKYNETKKLLTDLERQGAEAAGALKQIKKELKKEFKCRTIKEAKKKLKEMEKKQEEAWEKFNEEFEALQRRDRLALEALEEGDIDTAAKLLGGKSKRKKGKKGNQKTRKGN